MEYDPEEAAASLRRADKKLGRLMDRVGAFDVEMPARLDPFQALVRSIIYQQLSGKAAGTIYGRVCALFPGRRPGMRRIAEMPEEQLRGAGMSRAKVAAVKDLAQKTLEGVVPGARALQKMDDAEIVSRLTSVRGIGEWTVQMMLMFHMGRPDVLPVKDLGVRKGFMLTYGLAEMPEPSEMINYCVRWKPYRSVASWYMWRAVDLHEQSK